MKNLVYSILTLLSAIACKPRAFNENMNDANLMGRPSAPAQSGFKYGQAGSDASFDRYERNRDKEDDEKQKKRK